MSFYPVCLNLRGRRVLLVGGGTIALQKLQGLLEAEASIRLIAPEVLEDISGMARAHRLDWQKRPYTSTDLDGVVLVIAATDDEGVQKQVAADARARGLWVNVVDVPPLCDFIAPAIIQQGDIQVSVSTGGASPALAKFLRRKLEPLIGREYAELAQIAQRYRADILKLPKPRRQALWECIISEGFIEQIRTQGAADAELRLKEWLYGKPAV